MLHAADRVLDGANKEYTMSRFLCPLTVPDAILPRPSLVLRTGAFELTSVARLSGPSRQLLHRRHYGL
jgi:hypothetical protein